MRFSKISIFAVIVLVLGGAVAYAFTSSNSVHDLSVSANSANMPMKSNSTMTGKMNGLATGVFSVDTKKNTLCYSVMTMNMTGFTEAHIEVTATETDIAIFDVANLNKKNKSCINIAAKISSDMVAHPGNYAFMLHTKAYPEGAVMGELKRG